MLRELRIRDLGVIAEAVLDLGPGLNVLSGETGAGKTMVVSALELLLGARAEAHRVRAGRPVAIVEACLTPPPAGAEQWLDPADDELIVSREIAADSQTARSRARLGGRLAPVSALSACVGAVVELHGQADTARLLSPAVQRDLLDRSGGAVLAAALSAYREAFARWRAASSAAAQLAGSESERLRELDRLSFELAEIDAVNAQPGEEVAVQAELARLEHAESLAIGASTSAAALNDDGGGRDSVAAAAAALRPVEGVDEQLDALAARATSLTAELSELALDLSAYAAGIEARPDRLEALRERSADLNRLVRKYGDPSGSRGVEAVLAYAQVTRDRRDALADSDNRRSELAEQARRLREAVEVAAERLRMGRRAAGERLASAAAGHLEELALPQARLEVHLEPTAAADHGADRVEFLLAANPGQPALPLSRAASGGERSRVALALRLALVEGDSHAGDANDPSVATPVVLVFDEIDAGIGGATGQAVGRKLARLARGRQVLCVTHLAQLAAFADSHFLVTKTAGEQTVASVRKLDGQDRIAELSRMLSGRPDSSSALAHAGELRQAAITDAAR